MLLAAVVLISQSGAQETVYIGGRSAGPAVEVDLSVLDRAGPRRINPGPPDILPPDPANGPLLRAATSTRLTPPRVPAPQAAPLAAPAPMAAPSAKVSPPPAAPTPVTAGATPIPLTPAPLSPGLTPASRPVQPPQPANLTPAAPPKSIVPAKIAGAINTPPPPPVVSAPQKLAVLPPGLTPSAPTSGAAATLLFAPGAVDLSAQSSALLDALVSSLQPQQRLQLKSFAAGVQDDAEVRRIALKRALAARSHLLAKGLESTRIDVRALGPADDGGSSDRLDVIVVAQ